MNSPTINIDALAGSPSVALTRVGPDRAVLLLRLERPERANAYTDAMLDTIEDAFDRLAVAGSIRALVVTGSGSRAFCAGADRDELRGREALDGLELGSRRVFDTLAALPIPTIAAINGAAVGGGFELAMACDIRVCAPGATFRLPEVELGLSPAAGGMRRLPALVGMSRAKQIVLFGRELDAREAFDCGLVSHVGDDFEARAIELATRVCSKDPMALRLAKLGLGSEPRAGDLEGLIQASLYERRLAGGQR